jgi:FAD/FMN-containing dehydrogenase
VFSGSGNAGGRWDNRRCSPTFHDLHFLSHRRCPNRTLQLRELAWTRIPFAIKGGGHSLNPGFSSTSGIHISLRRMNDIVIHEDSKTVEIGAGLTWLDVYRFLTPKGINVVGGRLAKIGVAGFMLGGGDSSLSKVHGVDGLKSCRIFLEN